MYSRAGCHLCEDMIGLLGEFQADHDYELDIVDIDDDPVLKERFNVLVPALYLGDQEVCHHFLDMQALVQAMDDLYSERCKQLE